MKSNPALSPERAKLYCEWDDTERDVRALCSTLLTELGMSPPALEYVLGLKAYHRLPYLFALWATDDELRRQIGILLPLHSVGTKLLDNIIDNDQPYSTTDQMLGAYLMHYSMSSLCRLGNALRILEACDSDHFTLWQNMAREISRPARTFPSWMEYARIKTGLLFANYATMACLAGGTEEAVPAGRAFGEAFGNIIQIADDLADYVRLNEITGNLGHLLTSGGASFDEVRAEILDSQLRASTALRERPMAHDISFIVEAKAADALGKLEQLHASTPEEAGRA